MNTFGKIFTVTTYGESHGAAVGGVVDGMPAGIDIDIDFIQSELSRRRPGQSKITTSRNEADQVELLSGVFEGKSTGCPIGFIVRNTNQHSQDYENMRCTFRPSHADYTYQTKYGIRDHRGGGRTSARITIGRCVAGALAKLALKQLGISVQAYTSQVGDICLERDYKKYDLNITETNAVRCPDPEKAAQMEALISEVKEKGDTIGGVITCVIKGCPVGLGEPEFDKLHAVLGHAMLSINAVKGFEYGEGFAGVNQRGSQQNDVFTTDANGNICTKTNHSGGIQGGLSNGEDIYFRVAFKPVATILMEQDTVDMEGNATVLKARGRHDPCVLPRAVPPSHKGRGVVTITSIKLLSMHNDTPHSGKYYLLPSLYGRGKGVGLFFLLLFSLTTSAQWQIEAESPETSVTTLSDSIIDIVSPKGMTLWYNERMEGNTIIEYDARIVVEDNNTEPWNRLSDLNCFWMASDTHRESLNPLEGISERQGIFIQQYALSLYYLGFGGNHNKTTRFRRYTGDERGIKNTEFRPAILMEYTDSAHLLKKNHWYHIRLEQTNGCVRYIIDGEVIVEYQDPTPLTRGYFGFRTTLSHAQIRRFTYTCKPSF